MLLRVLSVGWGCLMLLGGAYCAHKCLLLLRVLRMLTGAYCWSLRCSIELLIFVLIGAEIICMG